jgi:hypothetical protein
LGATALSAFVVFFVYFAADRFATAVRFIWEQSSFI